MSHSELLDLCQSILESVGVPTDEAYIQAWALVEAEARGHPSHGVHRLEVIVERIRRGLAVPGRAAHVEWKSPAALSIDGQRGLGPVVAMQGVNALAGPAAKLGVAVASIFNSNHSGMVSLYVEELAKRGLIGLAFTISEALVHPWNGMRPLIGTNPIAIAVPADPEPFVLDMATSAVSMGKIIDYMNRGQSLEPGWAVDSQGDPTTNPSAARAGALSPFGGAKGYGLGLAFEILVGALTGAALGEDVTGTLDSTTVCNKGDLLMALDPVVFGVTGYRERTSRYLEAVRMDSGGEQGMVRIPGDGSRERKSRAMTEGIAINDSVWAVLRSMLTTSGSG